MTGRWGPRWLSRFRRDNAPAVERSLHDMEEFAAGRLPFLGQLWLRKIPLGAPPQDYGLVSCRVVTTAGVAFIIDAFQSRITSPSRIALVRTALRLSESTAVMS